MIFEFLLTAIITMIAITLEQKKFVDYAKSKLDSVNTALFTAFTNAARFYNVSLFDILKIAEIESGFRSDIINNLKVSSAGAVGIMQIVPKWHPEANVFNVYDNIAYGAEYYAKLLMRYNGDKTKALAAYNWGIGNVDKAIKEHDFNWVVYIPDETKNYIKKFYGAILT